MADNTVLNTGTGGDTLRTDDILGIKTQAVKIQLGIDGADDGFVAATNKLPVDGSGVTQPISAASLPLPTGAATEASLSAMAGDLGDQADAEAAGNGSLIAITKRLRTLLAGGLPAALVSGRLDVNVGNTIALPTGAATLAEQQTQTTALQLSDDVVHALNAAFNKAAAVAGQLDDTTPTAATEDNIAPVRITAQRAFHMNLRNVSGTEIGTSSAPVRTDPTGTTTQPISGTVTATATDFDIRNLVFATDKVDASGSSVIGSVAHDTGSPGNPIVVAGSAQDMDDTAPPNRVSAEADVTRLAVDRDGTQFVHPHGPQIWSFHENSSSTLTDTSVHTAPGAGLSLYVTDIVFSVGAATALNIFFEEGASTVLGPYYLEAVNGRGLHIRFATPKKITANTALTVSTSGAVLHSIDVTGFTAQG